MPYKLVKVGPADDGAISLRSQKKSGKRLPAKADTFEISQRINHLWRTPLGIQATSEAKAEEAKEDARDMYKAEMIKVQDQSKLAVAKLGEMKTASEESWETMVTEMEKVRDAFAHSFHYFKSQI